MGQTLVKLPEHQAIYRQIRNLILFGTLVPGQAVTIQGLAEMIGAGITPVREAIRRLTAEGALQSGRNRRVQVPEMTREILDEIEYARLSIEPELARRAALRMDDDCLADLANIDAHLDQAIATGNIEGYLEFNYRFHFRLYQQAEAQVLTKIAASLWLQAGPSLRIVCGRFGTSNLPDMHSTAISALREGNADRASRAVADDIRQGLGQVRLTLGK